MANHVVKNWFGDIVSHPRVVVDARSVKRIVAVLKDPENFPSPVRAVGSNHSTAPCGVAEGGTLVRMKMNRILSIGTDTVTVQAGAVHYDIARELEKRNLQFYVNTEIGSLSAGSAACAGTKDASMPGEHGQVGSYIIAVKMVLPSGDLLEVDESQPDLLRKVRSSYGTFGIIYEVTYRVRPLTPMAVYHETFTLHDFVSRLGELKGRNESMMYYLFPFQDLITVEFRKYNPDVKGEPNRHAWALRNHLWATSGPRLAHDVEQNIANPDIRYATVDSFNTIWRFKLETLVCSEYTIPGDQIIKYPPVSDESRYTFSLFAFPEERFPAVLSEFVTFCKEYYEREKYRSNMLYVGYRSGQDQHSLLSYAHEGPVMTIDPVSTANPGWKKYLEAYNQFCSDRGGIPLLNQTFGVTRAIAQKAFGERLRVFEETRRSFDPSNRLLNEYFSEVLGSADPPAGARNNGPVTESGITV